MNNKEYLRQAKERLEHDNKLRKEGMKEAYKELLKFGKSSNAETPEELLAELEQHCKKKGK